MPKFLTLERLNSLKHISLIIFPFLSLKGKKIYLHAIAFRKPNFLCFVFLQKMLGLDNIINIRKIVKAFLSNLFWMEMSELNYVSIKLAKSYKS